MVSTVNTFGVLIDTFISGTHADKRYDCLADACSLLTEIPDDSFSKCYSRLSQLNTLKTDWWQVFRRLCNDGKWRSIAYLIYGSTLNIPKFQTAITVDVLNLQWLGVARTCPTTDLQTNTIMSFLKQCDPVIESRWLDAVLCAVIYRGNQATWNNLAVDADDCALHAATRFCLLTKRTSLLEHFIKKEWVLENGGRNSKGETVFHCIAKMSPLPEEDVLLRVTDILKNKGLWIFGRDAHGKSAVEYFSPLCSKDIIHTYSEVIIIMDKGKKLFRNGEFKLAIDSFSQIILDVEWRKDHFQTRLDRTTVAVFYWHRADAYYSIESYDDALRDAKQCLLYDEQHYKAHMLIGKCCKVLHQDDEAVNALMKAYIFVESHTEDKIKVEILSQIATTKSTKFDNLPTNQGHVWLKACYELIQDGDWNSAKVAFQQFTLSESNPHGMSYDLKPLCDMSKLIEHDWVLDVMVELLKRGCDRNTIRLNTPEKYSHVVVKMSIKARNVNLLKYVVEHYDDWNVVDHQNGNTLLHVASIEPNVDVQTRRDVTTLLLQYGVKADLKNYQQQLASDFLSNDECENKEGKTTEEKLQKSSSDHNMDDKMGNIDDKYEKLVTALNQSHTEIESVKKAVSEMVKKLSSTSINEIPECLAKVDREPFRMITEKMGDLNKWPLLNKFVRKLKKMKKKRWKSAGKLEEDTEDFFSEFAVNMTVLPVVKCDVSETEQLEIIRTILENGASLGDDSGATALQYAKEAGHYVVLEELVMKGADTKNLSVDEGDTPIHAAVKIVLKHLKSCALLTYLLEVYWKDKETQQHLNPEQLDVNDECIFHLIAKVKCNHHVLELTEMLSANPISARYHNKKNELPTDNLTTKDARHKYIKQAEKREPSTKQSSRKEKECHDNRSEIIYKRKQSVKTIEDVSYVSETEARKKRIKDMIESLPETKKSVVTGRDATQTVNKEIIPEIVVIPENTGTDHSDVVDEKVEKTIAEDSGDTRCEIDAFGIDTTVFDKLAWEVECTSDVWKTLRDKHVPSNLKRRIVKEIRTLASGEWQPHSLNKLHHNEASLKLFEVDISKDKRIIWELAIDFSPRLTETFDRSLEENFGDANKEVCDRRIYTEIIRIWDIVLDHDKIKRSIERITKAHRRGQTCALQKCLRGLKADTEQIASNKTIRYPMTYVEDNIPKSELEQLQHEMTKFHPPGSPNDREYHILKFYSFSSTLVSHILQNIETNVDFPFRVSGLEHEIINMASKSPVLLIGRSGTGKTTCCLYRLWSKFQAYWKTARISEPLLPRALDIVHQDAEKANKSIDSESTCESNQDYSEAANLDSNKYRTETERQDDHLHQLFVTKNAVLASEVHKNFRELRQADEKMQEQLLDTQDVLPNRLQDIEDASYPLFLTSRQLFVMLDASLGPPYFFERKEDGSLKVDVTGWTDLDSPLSLLQMLDNGNDETDVLQETDDITGSVEPDVSMKERTVKSVDPRREVTYTVFAAEIWPKIKTKNEKHHPSLIWTELMSFIKGSYEALSGNMDKENYVHIGEKRAPNFKDDRNSIYDISKRYDEYKRHRNMFDETDLVHNVFGRLRQIQTTPWVLHQIYVDETQDFTQAELCLLIRLCQNPNEMFMTGDTAQSIMKGISFRFCDLSSLFYYARETMRVYGKASVVEVPKRVHQLTYNYRSHTGILSLATSVLDLILCFFPGSIDRLEPDQGLFPGPQPILLESCSFADLAVLLRGNQRKTSRIEFGAHQAILVVDDHSKENIPEELRLGLVLTIYEAKGLEFDDVLLYNFFKDSQAGEEWRVVTSYLKELAEGKENLPANADLVMIDQEILSSKHRARPLDFDERRHKVLNSELKLLYTAITRARVNVWIFDENEEKRTPVFEYFKARKLVKSLQIQDISEACMNENIFPEKSSQSDWIKRGEECMRRKLYSVAVKCFSMGGDVDKENEALAYQKIMAIFQLNDEDHKKKREECLKTAELFLKCNATVKAAVCLKLANEGQLAANVYEKIGQYEKAADVYEEMKLPLPRSKCYEMLENYSKALEVLDENEEFKAALEVLKRYELLIKNLKEKNEPIPQHLKENAPPEDTEDHLNYRFAEWCHKRKNKEKVMKLVKRLKPVMQIKFLVDRQYIVEAAKIHEDNGEFATATRLLCIHGFCSEAVKMSRKTEKTEWMAHALLVESRKLISDIKKKEEDDLNTDVEMAYLKQHLEEADTLQLTCTDIKCQIGLLHLELEKDFESRKRARKMFEAFDNEAGLVEYYNLLFELIKKKNFESIEVLQSIFEGIKCILSVCRTLHGNMPGNKLTKYYELYGLTPSGREELIFHPNENPICKEMLCGHKHPKGDCEVKIERKEAHAKIINFLLRRGEEWLNKLQKECKDRRKCILERLPDGGYCRQTLDMTQKTLQCLYTIDLFLVSIEEYRVNSWNRMYREKIGVVARSKPYVACILLLNDLIPLTCHPLFLTSWYETMENIRKDKKILAYFKLFISKRRVDGGNDGEMVNAIDELALYHVGSDLMEDCDNSQQMSSSVIWQKGEFEDPKAQRIRSAFFTEAICDLENGNPLESIIKFCMFQLQPGNTYVSENKMYPDLKHVLLWIEFFVSLSFMMIAKLKKQGNRDVKFIIPNNYYFLSNVMLTTFIQSQLSLENMVTIWEPDCQKDAQSNVSLVQRLEEYLVVVSGYSHDAKILDLIVDRCLEDKLGFVLLERFLILGLTMICNTDRVVSEKTSSRILSSLKKIKPLEGAPERLKNALNRVNRCTLISDIVDVLSGLYEQRNMDGNIMVCGWNFHQSGQTDFLKNIQANYTLTDQKFLDKPLPVVCVEDCTENITIETLKMELQQLEKDVRDAHQET